MDFNDIVLENERVKLSPLSIKHLDKLLSIAIEQPTLLQYSPSPFGSESALKQYIEEAILSRVPFILFDKENEAFAGSSSYGNISVKDQRLEIGWTWIGEQFQGTGLNKACKYLMLEHAFEALKMERVEFKIDSRNTKSRTAVTKIGGVFEGELRSHTVMNDGFRRNTCYYSILSTEWLGIKNSIFKNFQ